MSNQYGQLNLIDSESDTIQSFPLKHGVNLIGSSPQVNIRLYKHDILPLHCFIEVKENRMAVISAFSNIHYTYLNNKVLRKGNSKLIVPSDVIALSNIKFVYENDSLDEEDIRQFKVNVIKTKFFSTPRANTVGFWSGSRRSLKAKKQPWRWDVLDTVPLPSSPLTQETSETKTPNKNAKSLPKKTSTPFLEEFPSEQQKRKSSVKRTRHNLQEELSRSVEKLIKIASNRGRPSRNIDKKNFMLQNETSPVGFHESLPFDDSTDENFKTPKSAPFFAPLVRSSLKKSARVSGISNSSNVILDQPESVAKISSCLKYKTPAMLNKHRTKLLRNSTGKILKKRSNIEASLSVSFNILDRRNRIPRRTSMKSNSNISLHLEQEPKYEQNESFSSLIVNRSTCSPYLRSSSTPKIEKSLRTLTPKETAITCDESFITTSSKLSNKSKNSESTMYVDTNTTTPTATSNSFVYESPANIKGKRLTNADISGINILNASKGNLEENEDKIDYWSPIYCSSTGTDDSEIDRSIVDNSVVESTSKAQKMRIARNVSNTKPKRSSSQESVGAITTSTHKTKSRGRSSKDESVNMSGVAELLRTPNVKSTKKVPKEDLSKTPLQGKRGRKSKSFINLSSSGPSNTSRSRSKTGESIIGDSSKTPLQNSPLKLEKSGRKSKSFIHINSSGQSESPRPESLSKSITEVSSKTPLPGKRGRKSKSLSNLSGSGLSKTPRSKSKTEESIIEDSSKTPLQSSPLKLEKSGRKSKSFININSSGQSETPRSESLSESIIEVSSKTPLPSKPGRKSKSFINVSSSGPSKTQLQGGELNLEKSSRKSKSFVNINSSAQLKTPRHEESLNKSVIENSSKTLLESKRGRKSKSLSNVSGSGPTKTPRSKSKTEASTIEDTLKTPLQGGELKTEKSARKSRTFININSSGSLKTPKTEESLNESIIEDSSKTPLPGKRGRKSKSLSNVSGSEPSKTPRSRSKTEESIIEDSSKTPLQGGELNLEKSGRKSKSFININSSAQLITPRPEERLSKSIIEDSSKTPLESKRGRKSKSLSNVSGSGPSKTPRSKSKTEESIFEDTLKTPLQGGDVKTEKSARKSRTFININSSGSLKTPKTEESQNESIIEDSSKTPLQGKRGRKSKSFINVSSSGPSKTPRSRSKTEESESESLIGDSLETPLQNSAFEVAKRGRKSKSLVNISSSGKSKTPRSRSQVEESENESTPLQGSVFKMEKSARKSKSLINISSREQSKTHISGSKTEESESESIIEDLSKTPLQGSALKVVKRGRKSKSLVNISSGEQSKTPRSRSKIEESENESIIKDSSKTPLQGSALKIEKSARKSKNINNISNSVPLKTPRSKSKSLLEDSSNTPLRGSSLKKEKSVRKVKSSMNISNSGLSKTPRSRSMFKNEESLLEESIKTPALKREKSARKAKNSISFNKSSSSALEITENQGLSLLEDLVTIPLPGSPLKKEKNFMSSNKKLIDDSKTSKRKREKSLTNVVLQTPELDGSSGKHTALRSTDIEELTSSSKKGRKSRKSTKTPAKLQESLDTENFDISRTEVTPLNIIKSKMLKRLKTPMSEKVLRSSRASSSQPARFSVNVLTDITSDINISEEVKLKSPEEVTASQSSKRGKQRSPMNDLTDVRGVKKLLKTPKPQKEPVNDLRNIPIIKPLFGSPKEVPSPLNDLSDVRGIKKLLKTPKIQKEPLNDLGNVAGVKNLFLSSKKQRSPKNDLTNVKGVKRLLKTPKPVTSPTNDLTDIRGVKKLFASAKKQLSPNNDLSDIRGVRRLLSTPQNSPKNDLTNIVNIRNLFVSSKKQKSPKNDLTAVHGVRALLKTPKALNETRGVEDLQYLFDSNEKEVGKRSAKRKSKTEVGRPSKKLKRQNTNEGDYTDVGGVKRMFAEAEANHRANKTNISGVADLFQDEFDKLLGKEPVRQYPGKNSPVKLSPLSKSKNLFDSSLLQNSHLERWIEDQNKTLPTSTPKNANKKKALMIDLITPEVETKPKRALRKNVDEAKLEAEKPKLATRSRKKVEEKPEEAVVKPKRGRKPKENENVSVESIKRTRGSKKDDKQPDVQNETEDEKLPDVKRKVLRKKVASTSEEIEKVIDSTSTTEVKEVKRKASRKKAVSTSEEVEKEEVVVDSSTTTGVKEVKRKVSRKKAASTSEEAEKQEVVADSTSTTEVKEVKRKVSRKKVASTSEEVEKEELLSKKENVTPKRTLRSKRVKDEEPITQTDDEVSIGKRKRAPKVNKEDQNNEIIVIESSTPSSDALEDKNVQPITAKPKRAPRSKKQVVAENQNQQRTRRKAQLEQSETEDEQVETTTKGRRQKPKEVEQPISRRRKVKEPVDDEGLNVESEKEEEIIPKRNARKQQKEVEHISPEITKSTRGRPKVTEENQNKKVSFQTEEEVPKTRTTQKRRLKDVEPEEDNKSKKHKSNNNTKVEKEDVQESRYSPRKTRRGAQEQVNELIVANNLESKKPTRKGGRRKQ